MEELNGIRVVVPVVIEMTREQLREYAYEYGLPKKGGELAAAEVVADVRSYALTAIQDSPAFGERGNGDGSRGADVTLKDKR